MDSSNNNCEEIILSAELGTRSKGDDARRSSCQVLKSPSEIARARALVNNNRGPSFLRGNSNISCCPTKSQFRVTLEKESGSIENLLEIDCGDMTKNKESLRIDDDEDNMDDGDLDAAGEEELLEDMEEVEQQSSEVSVSSGEFSGRLCQVDPIIDFWMVDEEYSGKFRISSFPPSEMMTNSLENMSTLPSPTAVIFKVKTTSPFNFWVRPCVGLMKPNCICTVEVICEGRASKTTMSRDEFVVEIAPVPGAAAEMTSDLYTSSVASNLPELLSLWERVEEEEKSKLKKLSPSPSDPSLTSFGVPQIEYHRISCRFRRITPLLVTTKSFEVDMNQNKGKKFDEKQKEDVELIDDKDKEVFRGRLTQLRGSGPQEVSSLDGFSRDKPPVECYMAREYYLEVEVSRNGKRANIPSYSLGKICRSKTNGELDSEGKAEAREEEERRRSTLTTKLKFVNIVLTTLLSLSVGYIIVSHSNLASYFQYN